MGKNVNGGRSAANAACQSLIGHPKLWVSALQHPIDAFESQRSGMAPRNLAAGLALDSLAFVASWLAFSLFWLFISNGSGDFPAGFDRAVPSLLVSAITLFAEIFVALLALGCYYFIFAMVLGGKARFVEHAHAVSLFAGAFALLSLACMAIYIISFNIVPILPYISFSLACVYGIYMYAVLMRHVHKLSALRTALMVVLPIFTALALFAAWMAYLVKTHGLGIAGRFAG